MTIKNILYTLLTIGLLGFVACEPDIDDKLDLPTPPAEATFNVADLGDNTYTFTNTTEGGFLFQWDLGNGLSESSEAVTVTYPMAGAYVVTLTVFNAGGHAVGSQSIIVENDLEVMTGPCEAGSLADFLSNCDTKTWKLTPEEGALLVAPADEREVWWQSDANVPNERFCAWDDTWTFTGDGDMIYDTKGDIWGEDYLGFNFECVPTADMPDDVAAWGDGTHNYTTSDATQEFTLNGVGAFMGIPKAANGSEVGFPQGAVTYKVVSTSTNADGKGVLVIRVEYNTGTELAYWQFTFLEE